MYSGKQKINVFFIPHTNEKYFDKIIKWLLLCNRITFNIFCMSLSHSQDPHGILADMHTNGSYVTRNHIVYKAGTHGEEYLDKDAHLNHPEAAEKVAQLLSQQIVPGSIIIAPETRSKVVLWERVAHLTQSRFVPTQKINDIHTFSPEITPLLRGKHTRILIDDILNNGETLSQIQKALGEIGIEIDEFHVMVDRNPQKSDQLWVVVKSLAQLQIPQWNEKDVPEWLKARPITTKLGKARNWVPKSPGEVIAYRFFLERIAKQDLGFIFDDGMRVQQFDQDGFMLRPVESLAEVIDGPQ